MNREEMLQWCHENGDPDARIEVTLEGYFVLRTKLCPPDSLYAIEDVPRGRPFGAAESPLDTYDYRFGGEDPYDLV